MNEVNGMIVINVSVFSKYTNRNMAGNIFNESESHFGSLTPEKCLATEEQK
jgi:hypothetical protein